MEDINEQKKKLNTKLFELKNLNSEARIDKYQNEIRFEIVELLQKSYPDNLMDTNVFYNSWFKSLISFYDPDMLMVNLFLDKDFVNIFNYLLKTEALKGILKPRLSPLMVELLNFSDIQWAKNSSFSDKDEECFLRIQFGVIISDISNSDWSSGAENSNLLDKFVKWLDSNLDNGDFENLFTAFLLFVKIWNSSNQFSDKNFNLKAIGLYNRINKVLQTRLTNLNSDSYIIFIKKLKKRFSDLFTNINYIPLLDESEHNRYEDSYLKHRERIKVLYSEAVSLNEISPNYSFIELLRDISEDTPEYFVRTYELALIEKIEQFQFPSKNEIELISFLASNKNIQKIRGNMFRKLYLFEIN
jgi:hypothetical protein